MLDITNIADLWIWVILFVGLLVPMLRKRSNSVVDRTRTSPRAAWAWIALATLITYEGARFALHAKAIEMLDSQKYSSDTQKNQAPYQTIAVPLDFFHPALWKGIARCEGFDVILPFDVQQAFNAASERTFLDPPPGDPSVAAARKLSEFQTMLRFSQAPFWKVTPLSNRTLVELIDLRYGTPDNPGFAVASGLVSRTAP
jgi:hypothetical protein